VTATASASISMDRMYRRQRHIYDLTRKFYLLGRDRLIEGLAPAGTDCVLEIGCGTGRNLIRAARRYPHARFFGIDVSSEMLVSACESIARSELSSRVTVQLADATAFDALAVLGRPQFERIFISYSLSMIPEWRSAIAKAVSLLAVGGELHIVDFGGQEGLPDWFRSALRHWLTLFHVTPRDDLELTLTTFARPGCASLIHERPYRGYSQLAVLKKLRD
jgi:S-adenosylmethionine-diacylgycerolhomoserine-N-methlytransferase